MASTRIEFIRINVFGSPLPRCGHGSHTGDQCARHRAVAAR